MVPKAIVNDFWKQVDSIKDFANLVAFQVGAVAGLACT